jgi:Arc/MetJ-type ribon-helix-helix transcriptional regulator
MALKSALIPQVRVEPELRAELEAVLRQGESLSEFVEASVRSAVQFRQAQGRFHERGEAAWQQYQADGVALSLDDVVAGLKARVAAKRKQLGK